RASVRYFSSAPPRSGRLPTPAAPALSVWLLSDMFDPILVLVDFAAHGTPVLFGDGGAHRSGARNRPVVDGVHRAHFRGGPAHEHLLGHVQIATGQLTDAHFVAEISGDRHHRALRDALQRT